MLFLHFFSGFFSGSPRRPRLRHPLIACFWLAFLLSPAAHAGHDEEVALSSVIARAHDHGDTDGLLLMMTPAERVRAARAALQDQFELHLRTLGVTALVTCTQVDTRPATLYLPALDEYRCSVLCRLGDYGVRVLMSPPDPLVVPAPRPGHIARLLLTSPLLDAPLWPTWLAGHAGLLIGALWLLALACSARGLLWLLPLSRWRPRMGDRLGRWAPVIALRIALARLWRWYWYQGLPPQAARPESRPSPQLEGALHHGAFLLRLLGALAVPALFLPLLWRCGPLPLWGDAAVWLACAGLLFLSGGLVLSALADFHWSRPRRGPHPPLFPLLFAVLLLGSGVLLVGDSALPDEIAAPLFPHLQERRQRGSYRVPLRRGPALVRRGDGPLLDLVMQHDDGRSCHAGAGYRGCRAFGAEVVAPADGVVVEAVDRQDDQELGQRDREHPAGNYLVFVHGHGEAGSSPSVGRREYTLLSHLARGSLRVRAGQQVRAGQVVALLGNSGDSDEPHLSMQILPEPLPGPGLSENLPCCTSFDESSSQSPRIFLRDYRVQRWLYDSLVPDGVPLPGQRISPLSPD